MHVLNGLKLGLQDADGQFHSSVLALEMPKHNDSCFHKGFQLFGVTSCMCSAFMRWWVRCLGTSEGAAGAPEEPIFPEIWGALLLFLRAYMLLATGQKAGGLPRMADSAGGDARGLHRDYAAVWHLRPV